MNTAGIMMVWFCLSVFFVGCLIPFGSRIGLVDEPTAHRTHRVATPLVGGIGIYCAIVAGSFLLDARNGFGISDGVLVACGLLVIMGVLDDYFELGARVRLVVEAIAACLVIDSDGLVVHSLGPLLGGEVIDLGSLAIPFTVFAMVGAMNAMNMIDGLDGLAGTVALAVFLVMALAAATAGLSELVLLLVGMSGVTAGFLLYNFRFDEKKRAVAFLGDAGSTLLGFLVAVLLIMLTRDGSGTVPPAAALWFFGLPLYDTLGVMVRRIWFKQSPFKADRNHLHHLLLDAGFHVRETVLILFLLQVMSGFIGLAGVLFGMPDAALFYLFLAGWFLYLRVIISPWRFIPRLQGLRDQVAVFGDLPKKIYVGNLPLKLDEALTHVKGLLHQERVDAFHLYVEVDSAGEPQSCYCLVHIRIGCEHLLNVLQQRNAAGLEIHEYVARRKMRWMPFLRRMIKRLFNRAVRFRARRGLRTFLVYSSIRDFEHCGPEVLSRRIPLRRGVR